MDTRLSKDELLKRLGTAIRLRRRAMKLSQDDLAAKAEINRAHYGEVERGKRNPSLWALYKITEALDIGIDDMFKAMSNLDGRFI